MRRPWLIWPAFGLCVALAASAMARVGSTALRLERAEARTRRQAALDENLQLALWRMDSALAPWIAEESARPYFAYTSFYPAERTFTCMFAEIQRGDVLVASPVLTSASPQIRLHFQYRPDGKLVSPQAPLGNMRNLAEARYLPNGRIEQATRQLDELARLVSLKELDAALPAVEASDPALETPNWMADQNNAASPYEQNQGQTREMKSTNEKVMRTRNTKRARYAPPAPARGAPTARPAMPVSQGPLQAIWIGRVLLLARRVRVEEGTFLQGCWLDWDSIRRELLASVADLLPDPSLEPVGPSDPSAPTRTLAALPVRLNPGTAAIEAPTRFSPVELSLAIAWASLAITAAAVAFLLRGAVALSERRGTFVSAVTHELRTPLTTFRLYTEMLTEGMVADPDTRLSYLKTLRNEADRLGHLVENVLSFARLERGRPPDHAEVVSAAELFDRLAPRLAARAEQGGMELAVDAAPAAARLRVDSSMIDQILANLVDNASKYARTAEDRRIHLGATVEGKWLAMTVRDHGPGIASQVRRRLFRPFSKSAHDAACTAPGVGLGLALSRRLARAQGGDLRLRQDGPMGACFLLILPLSR